MANSSIKIERSTYGVWVKRGNRSRFILCSDPEMAAINLEALERTRRSFARGTHEPVWYYRDDSGRVCIPPDKEAIPPGVARLSINNLRDADRLTKEVRDDLQAKFAGDSFTEEMEANLGSPRKALLDRMAVTHSNFERDTIRLLIKDMDNEENKRQSMEAHAHFHWRES